MGACLQAHPGALGTPEPRAAPSPGSERGRVPLHHSNRLPVQTSPVLKFTVKCIY